uniref:Uncharacterized protein n=1 Tax=Heterorhabditis bacteriophora TaxID=37862 RepID=A0A1I7WR15_HETBA
MLFKYFAYINELSKNNTKITKLEEPTIMVNLLIPPVSSIFLFDVGWSVGAADGVPLYKA